MNKREWMLQGAIAAVRSGNNFDDHEMATALSALYDAIVAASPEPADSDWRANTGEQPYPEGRVEVKQRDGKIYVGNADQFTWRHYDENEDIMDWKPAPWTP